MNAAELTRLLREAHAASRLTVWELSRRANVKERLVEAAFADAGRVTVQTLSRLSEALGMELFMAQATVPIRCVVDTPTVVDEVLRRLAPETVLTCPSIEFVLTVGFEGVLVSDSDAGRARPGLRFFLECCRALFSRIVVHVWVSQNRFRELTERLVDEGSVPPWFAAVEYAAWQGRTNDRSHVAQADIGAMLLVDRIGDGMNGGQTRQFIPIAGYKPPFDPQDNELARVLEELVRRTAHQPAGRSSGAVPDDAFSSGCGRP